MSSPFQIGDVVILKSGGPEMTVESVGEEIDCTWFAKDERKYASFNPALIKKNEKNWG